MQINNTPIDGLFLISPSIFQDERGFFLESYHQKRYNNLGIPFPFVQDNLSFSRKGTLRGLHYQSNPGQAKLVSCLQGVIWDVAVDIRPHSPTFGKWFAVELDSQKPTQFFIPVGFAHGFCVLSETAHVHYKVSSFYDPKTEQSILWNDPNLQIAWPISQPLLSPRDAKAPLFQEIVWTL